LITTSTILPQISQRLSPFSDTASLDAQVVLAQVLDKPRSWVLAHPETELSPYHAKKVADYLARLEEGEPLPYVLGNWEFFGLTFNLNHSTLIPRPETEILVEHALSWITRKPTRIWGADVGTGSGCIAVALASHAPHLNIIASDISLPALRVAQKNARKHNVEAQVHFVQSDLMPKTTRSFELICANLPYIPKHRLDTLQVSKWEPKSALNGGANGLEIIQRFIKNIPIHMASNGLLLLEVDTSQAKTVCALAHKSFPQAKVQILLDLAGHKRLISIEQ